MRHGQAADKSIDPEQGLSEDGKTGIELIAKSLAKKHLHIDQIFHSTKQRARQTAIIVADIISPNVTPQTMDNLKPGDNPENIINTINNWTDDTLIVSHLPFIPSLLNLLTNQHYSITFTPGTVVCLKRSEPQWQLEWTTSQ